MPPLLPVCTTSLSLSRLRTKSPVRPPDKGKPPGRIRPLSQVLLDKVDQLMQEQNLQPSNLAIIPHTDSSKMETEDYNQINQSLNHFATKANRAAELKENKKLPLQQLDKRITS